MSKSSPQVSDAKESLGRGFPSPRQRPDKLQSVLDRVNQGKASVGGIYLTASHRATRVTATNDLQAILTAISDQTWLTQDRVIERLGLSTEQQQRLDQLKERAQRLTQDWNDLVLVDIPRLREFRGQALSKEERPDTERFILEKRIELFELRSQELQAEISQVLSPGQFQVLSQYENRNVLFQCGVAETFSRALHATGELSQDDLQKIKVACGRVSSEIISRATALARKQGEETLRCLTVEQAEQLKVLLGDWEALLQPIPELLVFQLRHVGEGAEQPLDIVREWARYEKGWAPNSVGELRELEGVLQASPAALLQLAASPNYGRVSQWGSVSVEDAIERFNEVLLGANQDSLGSVGRNQGDAVRKQLATEALRQDLNTVTEPLTPQQWEQLEVVLLRRLVALKGIDSCCLQGNLGKKLALTKTQQELIQALAEDHLVEAIGNSQELEHIVWDAVRQELSDEQARRIREQYVVSVEGVAGAPVLLMMSLTTSPRAR